MAELACTRCRERKNCCRRKHAHTAAASKKKKSSSLIRVPRNGLILWENPEHGDLSMDWAHLEYIWVLTIYQSQPSQTLRMKLRHCAQPRPSILVSFYSEKSLFKDKPVPHYRRRDQHPAPSLRLRIRDFFPSLKARTIISTRCMMEFSKRLHLFTCPPPFPSTSPNAFTISLINEYR